MRKPLMIVVFALTVLAGIEGAYAGPSQEDSIREWHERFEAAWNKHDTKALITFFADDADYVSGWGRFVKGREEIEKWLAEAHSTVLKGAQLNSRVDTVRFLRPGIAVVDGTFETTGVHNRRGELRPTVHGHFTWVIVKNKGRWWVVSNRVFGLRPPPE